MLIDTLAEWLEGVVGPSVTVIIAYQNNDTPSGDYLTIEPLTNRGLGHPVQTVSDPIPPEEEGGTVTADVTNEQFEERTFQLNVYSDNGEAILDDIICANYEPGCPDTIMLIEAGSIRNLTQLDDTSYLPRYECDMTFGFSHERTVNVPTAENVHLTGDFGGTTAEVGEEPEA